ncbi:MAG: DUF2065 domain-containing protein [Halothiobacillaceae bacterium]
MPSELWMALALVLIIEGLLPFASPRHYRRMVRELAALPDGAIRATGLVLVLAGLLALWWLGR